MAVKISFKSIIIFQIILFYLFIICGDLTVGLKFEITEIDFNPIGSDNNKEFIEFYLDFNNTIIKNLNIEFSDFSSSDDLVFLQNNTSSNIFLIVESDFNYENFSCNILSAGPTIGNNLNNENDLVNLTINYRNDSSQLLSINRYYEYFSSTIFEDETINLISNNSFSKSRTPCNLTHNQSLNILDLEVENGLINTSLNISDFNNLNVSNLNNLTSNLTENISNNYINFSNNNSIYPNINETNIIVNNTINESLDIYCDCSLDITLDPNIFMYENGKISYKHIINCLNLTSDLYGNLDYEITYSISDLNGNFARKPKITSNLNLKSFTPKKNSNNVFVLESKLKTLSCSNINEDDSSKVNIENIIIFQPNILDFDLFDSENLDDFKININDYNNEEYSKNLLDFKENYVYLEKSLLVDEILNLNFKFYKNKTFKRALYLDISFDDLNWKQTFYVNKQNTFHYFNYSFDLNLLNSSCDNKFNLTDKILVNFQGINLDQSFDIEFNNTLVVAMSKICRDIYPDLNENNFSKQIDQDVLFYNSNSLSNFTYDKFSFKNLDAINSNLKSYNSLISGNVVKNTSELKNFNINLFQVKSHFIIENISYILFFVLILIFVNYILKK